MSAKRKISDEEIRNVVREHKALKQSELEELLGYSHCSLNQRLHRMVMEKKLKSQKLPSRSPAGKIVLFRGYTDVSLYYVRKSDFNQWIKSKLPKNLPKNFRKILTMKLHNIGLEVDFASKNKARLVSVDPKLHNRLKKIADKNNKSIKFVVDKAIRAYLKTNN